MDHSLFTPWHYSGYIVKLSILTLVGMAIANGVRLATVAGAMQSRQQVDIGRLAKARRSAALAIWITILAFLVGLYYHLQGTLIEMEMGHYTVWQGFYTATQILFFELTLCAIMDCATRYFEHRHRSYILPQ